MSSESIVFLGESQTFVGVLATVIVMCVLAGESNFIYQILTLIKKQMEDKLKDVSAVVSFQKLHNDSDFKLLKVLLMNKEQLNETQKDEGVKLLNKINLWKSSFQADIAKPDLTGTDRELTLAPLYTFLFVLVVFFFDELLRTKLIPYNNFLVSTLTLFTLFSSVYWIGKWFAYSFDIFHNNGRRTYTLLTESRWSGSFQSLHRGILHKKALRYSFEVLWFTFVVVAVWIAGIRGMLICYILTVFGVIVPLVFEGMYHLYPRVVSELNADKGYGATINHFGRFLLLSVILSFIYALLNQLAPLQGMLITYDSLRWLKVFTIGFVILNGLFIPSFIPYQTYRRLSNTVLDKPNRIQKNVDKDIDKRLDEIRAFTSKYKVD